MYQLIQPIGSMLIGLALSIYGLFHAAQYYPHHRGLTELWQMLPTLSQIGLFAIGVTAVIVGITLLSTGLYATRRRYRQLRQLLHNGLRHDPRMDADDDPSYYAGPGHYNY